MAFVGSILDLVQVLGEGGSETSADTNAFLGVIVSREVAYAISFGLRYLWFWGFVACVPPASTARGGNIHSGSWARWGFTGSILRWALVPAILAITSLQVIYRVYTPFSQYGPIYETEGTLQIVVSAIFILKLFLNIYLVALDSPASSSRVRTFLCYLPVLGGLLISLGIGVGNIIECK